ncbi:MAG: alpha/beta hydrolase [Erysipelotrichaceae bacterium]|nr:alpha/beta hydrolase [Erysipelotrichaceae bacterium]
MQWIIPDHEYMETMEKEVDPWLDALRKPKRISREKNRIISSESYRIPHSKGAVLISHGFTEAARKYHEVIYYFLKNGYDVHILDHCGHGNSYRLTGHECMVTVDDYRRYVEDLAFFARKIREEDPGKLLHLYCHSMGGGIGLQTAADYPALFDSVIATSPMILPDTGILPGWAATALAGYMVLKGKGETFGLGQGPYAAEAFELSTSASRERFDYYQVLREANPLLQTCGASWNWMRQAGLLNRALRKVPKKGMSCPVLLIQAELEAVVDNKASARFIRDLSKNSRAYLKVIKNARHEIYNSKAADLDPYWDTIFSFLETVQSEIQHGGIVSKKYLRPEQKEEGTR